LPARVTMALPIFTTQRLVWLIELRTLLVITGLTRQMQ